MLQLVFRLAKAGVGGLQLGVKNLHDDQHPHGERGQRADADEARLCGFAIHPFDGPFDAPGRATQDRLTILEAAQILRDRLGCGVAALGVLLQAAECDRLQIDRNPIVQAARRRRFIFENFRANLQE